MIKRPSTPVSVQAMHQKAGKVSLYQTFLENKNKTKQILSQQGPPYNVSSATGITTIAGGKMDQSSSMNISMTNSTFQATNITTDQSKTASGTTSSIHNNTTPPKQTKKRGRPKSNKSKVEDTPIMTGSLTDFLKKH